MEEKNDYEMDIMEQYPGLLDDNKPEYHPEYHDKCSCACEKSQIVIFGPCEDMKEVTVPDVRLKCEGRLLKVKVELRNVCAGRKIHLGILVSEEEGGGFKTKGFRATKLTIPGRPGSCINKIKVGDFCFVFPEEDSCCQRKFKINVVAHYSSFVQMDICHDL